MFSKSYEYPYVLEKNLSNQISISEVNKNNSPFFHFNCPITNLKLCKCAILNEDVVTPEYNEIAQYLKLYFKGYSDKDIEKAKQIVY